MLCRCREELHAAVGAVITGNGLSHTAAKATEAAAPEAAEASTTAARRIADRPTHAYEATRGRSPDWLKMKNADAPGSEPRGRGGLGQREVAGALNERNSRRE
jgi:hypothetical protein